MPLAKEYIDELTERTRKAAHRQFNEITAQGGMMVFIRDSRNEVLQSHVGDMGTPITY